MTCLRENASARIMYVILVARSEAILGRKSTRKPMQEIKIRFMDQRRVFSHSETVGFCLNAPAGPIWESSCNYCATKITTFSQRFSQTNKQSLVLR